MILLGSPVHPDTFHPQLHLAQQEFQVEHYPSSPSITTFNATQQIQQLFQMSKLHGSDGYKNKYQFLSVKYIETNGKFGWYHGKITRKHLKTGIGATFSDGDYHKFTWSQLKKLEKENRIIPSNEAKLNTSIKEYLSQHP